MVGAEGSNEQLITCKNTLIKSIKNIASSGNYEIYLYKTAGRSGLIFHKKKKEIEKELFELSHPILSDASLNKKLLETKKPKKLNSIQKLKKLPKPKLKLPSPKKKKRGERERKLKF